MHSVRQEMGPLGKLWSLFIHFPPVEILLTLLNRTVLRPFPLLVAALVGLLGGLGLYGIALYNGYVLSGAEIPFLIIGGLFLGIIFDYLRIFFNGDI